MKKLKQKGFTLIELMIVVAIIGILAAIAIPRFADMIEKSNEGATKGNLGSMKSATSIYYGDKEGVWPDNLTTAGTEPFSNYLASIPFVKVTGKFDTNKTQSPKGTGSQGQTVALLKQNVVPTTQGTGWAYDSTSGTVFVNSTLRDFKVLPYSTYGFE